jgi:hypothetical protein
VGRHSLHALYQVGVAEDAPRLQEVQHLREEFVDRGVLGSELVQCLPELECLLQILWTLTLCLGNSKVGDGG